MIRRSVIDYSLKRRSTLAELFSGRIGTNEVCDAHPYLLRAARFHGDKTDIGCPVCRRDTLTLVHYVYGDRLKLGAGQAKTGREIESMSTRVREFNVYVVEVCRGCSWNHLATSFVTGVDTSTPGTPRTPTPQERVGAARPRRASSPQDRSAVE